MRKRRLSPLWLGTATAIVMLAAAGAVFLSGMPSGPSLSLPWNRPMTVKAVLADSEALAPHAGVEIAGVKIGEVRAIDPQGNGALVTMQIEPKYADLRTDTRVLLRPHGLFGPKYIELQPGSQSAPPLHDGDTISAAQSVLPVDLDQVLQELQAPERQNLQTAIIELGKASAGRGTDVNQLVRSANTLTDVLDQPVKRLDQVAPNLSDMLVQDEAFNASFAQTPLDQLVANNNVVLGVFAQNADHLQSLLVHADSTLTTLDQALNGQSGNLRALLQTLPGTIDRLDRFNDLLSVFGASLTGKDGGTDVTQGIISAIENPRSAASSWDPCTPGKDIGCPADGKRHYLRVQVFSQPPTSTFNNVLCGLPLPPQLGGAIQCPPKTGGYSPDGAAPSLTTAQSSLDALGALIAS